MRVLLTVILFTLSCVALCDDVLLEEFNSKISKNIGNYKFEKKVDYEKKLKGGGYGIHYKSKMGYITLFVYNQNILSIPEGIKDKLIKAELSEAEEGMKIAESQGHYKDVKQIAIDKKLKKMIKDKFLATAYTFNVPGGGCKSFIFVRGHKNKFFKIRVTLYDVDGVIDEDNFYIFIKTINKIIP